MHHFPLTPTGTVSPPRAGWAGTGRAYVTLHICSGVGTQFLPSPQWARIQVWGGAHKVKPPSCCLPVCEDRSVTHGHSPAAHTAQPMRPGIPGVTGQTRPTHTGSHRSVGVMAPCRGADHLPVRWQPPVTPGSCTLPCMPEATVDGQMDRPDKRLRWNKMNTGASTRPGPRRPRSLGMAGWAAAGSQG